MGRGGGGRTNSKTGLGAMGRLIWVLRATGGSGGGGREAVITFNISLTVATSFFFFFLFFFLSLFCFEI